jgi:hypothetical protein
LPQENTQAPDDFNDYIAARNETGEPAKNANEEPSEAEGKAGDAEPDADATAESAGDPESPDDQEQDGESDTGGQQPKRKSSYQKRIDKLTRDKRELEARLAAIEDRVNGKSGGKADDRSSAPPAKAEPAGKPKVDDFETYEEFTEALAEWKIAQHQSKQTEAKQAREAEQQRKAVLDQWNSRADAVREKLPDYDEVLESADDVPLAGYLQEALLESEIGPELAYHLAKNRAELERLTKLSPTSAVRELGKIEASLSKTTAPQPKKQISTAPKPVTPLSGGTAGSAPSIYDESLGDDFAAYERVRRVQLKRE